MPPDPKKRLAGDKESVSDIGEELADLQASHLQKLQEEVTYIDEGCHGIRFLIDGNVMLGCSCRKL